MSEGIEVSSSKELNELLEKFIEFSKGEGKFFPWFGAGQSIFIFDESKNAIVGCIGNDDGVFKYFAMEPTDVDKVFNETD